MNFLNLQYFLVAAEELNFTRAAARLFITQQTLSSHISRLEEEIGTLLFDRTSPMALTPSGVCLVRHATTLLEEQKKTLQDIYNIKNNYTGELTVAIANERACSLLPPILSAFHDKFPNVFVRILEGSSYQEVERFLYQGEAECSIGIQISGNDAIVSNVLFTEKAVLAVPNSILETHFAQRGLVVPSPSEPIALRQFLDCPFIALSRSTLFGQNFIAQCQGENFVPNIIAEAPSNPTLIALCRAGLGIALCPKYIALSEGGTSDNSAAEAITLYELEKEQFNNNICINYFLKKENSGLLKEFVDFTCHYYHGQ